MVERNATVAIEKRIEFRVGINVGDIVIDADDIHGANVNIAARLEGICEVGGICISDDAYRHVAGKLPSADGTNLGSDKTVKTDVELEQDFVELFRRTKGRVLTAHVCRAQGSSQCR
jgi:class 3 adenylate cyclase